MEIRFGMEIMKFWLTEQIWLKKVIFSIHHTYLVFVPYPGKEGQYFLIYVYGHRHLEEIVILKIDIYTHETSYIHTNRYCFVYEDQNWFML